MIVALWYVLGVTCVLAGLVLLHWVIANVVAGKAYDANNRWVEFLFHGRRSTNTGDTLDAYWAKEKRMRKIANRWVWVMDAIYPEWLWRVTWRIRTRRQ